MHVPQAVKSGNTIKSQEIVVIFAHTPIDSLVEALKFSDSTNNVLEPFLQTEAVFSSTFFFTMTIRLACLE